MRVLETEIPGVLILEVEPIEDERGFFARSWDRQELQARGLNADVIEVSTALNTRAGTLRGLHYQVDPFEEAKTIRCIAGAVFDVAVDLRPGSKAFSRWVGTELSAANRTSLFIPEGCAHGYVTLAEGAEVMYQISAPYRPEAARGFRWDDPAFGIDWPVPVRYLSRRDASLPTMERQRS
jgi:dTDP-4-dehydrorhamnose 3,5-epimerase